MRHPFSDADEIFRAEIESRLEERFGLIDRVLERLAGAGCRTDPFYDRLVLDEAITNAILHGNRSDPAKKVAVRAFSAGERWGVEIRDQGDGFEWKDRLAVAAAPESITGPSGRGIALIRASGAELYFLDGGRCVVIVREGGAEGGAADQGNSSRADMPPEDTE